MHKVHKYLNLFEKLKKKYLSTMILEINPNDDTKKCEKSNQKKSICCM